ncbi:MAG: helix-turn-helix transcriptional regulator [Chthoniobacterales bacterium]
MKQTGWHQRVLESTRGRILQRLRAGDQTVNDLAHALHLTDNAVRAHLVSLERDRLVEQTGTRVGFRKPHATYGVTTQSEQIFPKAYGPLLDLVMAVFEQKVTPRELRSGMREVGRRIAAGYVARVRAKSRQKRIEAALAILHDLGGSATCEIENGRPMIRGKGCPLAAATARHPAACLIAESLLAEVIGAPVKQCCQHNGSPSCCFAIGNAE